MRERMTEEKKMLRMKQEQQQMRDFLNKQMEEKKNREKLEKELAALCGPEFLDNVQKQLPRYRAMVQGGLSRASGAPNLSVHLKQLSLAIAEYSTKVAASVDREDEESVQLAVAALAPIDRYREASLRRSAGAGGAPEPAPQPAPLGDDPSPVVGG